MKNIHTKVLIVIGFLFYSIILPAQTTTSRIWGVTTLGGISDYGLIYSTKPDGSDYTVEFRFDANTSNIARPTSNLTYGNDGNFYGFSNFFSASNQIITNKYILYKYNPNTNKVSKLETIIDAETWITTTPDKKHLLFAKSSGGAKGVGAIMRYTIKTDYLLGSQTSKLFTLRSFTNTAGGDYINGYNMETMPVVLNNNVLFGTCHNSGELDSNQGIFFSLGNIYESNPMPTTWKKFNSGSGENNGKWHKGLSYVEIGTHGYIFWQTSAGGNNNEGAIYRYSFSNNRLSKIHDFNNSDSDITKRGKRPFGGLVYTNDALYGTTFEGGTHNNGVIYSIGHYGDDYKIIKNIDNNNASYSYRNMGRGLFLSSNGKLYGTAKYGNTRPSSTDGGMMFCIDQWNNNSYSVVKTFQTTSEGENPYFELTEVNDCVPTSISINWPTNMTEYPTIKSHCGIVTEDDLMLEYEIRGSTEKRRLIATNSCGDIINFNAIGDFPISQSTNLKLIFDDEKGNRIDIYIRIDVTNELPVPIITDLPEIQSLCEIPLDNADFPKAEEECDGVIIGVPTIKGSSNAPQWPLTESTTVVWEYKSSKGKTITQEQQFTISKINTAVSISRNSITSEQTNGVTYEWQSTNGGTRLNPWISIAKAMSRTYKPTKNGRYRVKMTPINGGCSATYSDEVTIGNLKIEDLEKVLGIKVFPNPTEGLLQLERTNSIEINVEVIDITGKYILSTKTSKKNIAIDLRAYPNGIYNLIITDNKKSYSIRIIKK